MVTSINGGETGEYLEKEVGPHVGLLTLGTRRQLCKLFSYIGEKEDIVEVELRIPEQNLAYPNVRMMLAAR